MKSITLKSPAKINLYLRVINKRKDGFHNIETIFERVNLFDAVKIKENSLNKIRISCNSPDVPKDSSNTCFKAAQLLKNTFKINRGADIFINKRIPVAAGLGGGSSDAASVLLGLNKLWQLRLTKKQLIKLAQKIGSDVAFFTCQESFALGRGRGERIFPLKGIDTLWHIIVAPRIKLLTAKVYDRLNLRLTKKGVNVNILIHALRKNSAFLLGRFLKNDLEQAAFKIQPGLLNIKNRLEILDTQGVLLSGSGSAFFCLVNSRKQAQAVKRKLLPALEADFFIARTF
jgi:4-diphosphocytidyl-2-C-methyl-D-erythritol kinase